MSEGGFLIFSRLYGFGTEAVYAALLAAFFRPFLPGRSRKRRGPLAVFGLYILLETLCGWAPLPQGSFGPLLAAALLAASGWMGLERTMTLLLTILYFNTRIASGLMAESLYFILGRRLPFPEEPLEAVFSHAALLAVVYLLSLVGLFSAMLYALRRRLQRGRMPLHWRELCYLSVVPAAGILFGQMVTRLLLEIRDGALLWLYERHPAFLAVIPALALLFYAGAYLTIAFQQGMERLREEQATHYAEYQQIETIRTRIREAEGFYAGIRQLKHEMRGHLTNIRGLARSGEYASLEEYISRMDGSIRDLALTVQTGNPVTDVIVNDIRRRSADLGIRFQSELCYPGTGGYDAFDVGIILQNLLQNALEACERVEEGERYILLTGRRRGRFFLIEVKNPLKGEVVFGQDGLPVTTKKDAPIHGIGLSNVRREAEKYMGELELKADGREFSAAVLLQERSGEDEHR